MSLLTTVKGGSLLLNTVAAGLGSVVGRRQRSVRVIKRRFPGSDPEERVEALVEPSRNATRSPFRGSAAALGLAATGVICSAPVLTMAGGGLASFWLVPSFRESYDRLRRERRANAGFLIGLFSGVSLLWGRSLSGAAAMSIYLSGRRVIAATGRESRRVMASMMSRPGEADAWVIRDGIEIATPPWLVTEEDVVVVNAGAIVPVDGIVVAGEAEVQSNALTGGEPGRRQSGDLIHAATRITSGSVRLRKAV